MRLRRHLLTSSKGLLDPPRPPCSKLERWHNPGDRSFPGGVAERLIAPVLKTGRPKGLVSSNLTPSASLRLERSAKRKLPRGVQRRRACSVSHIVPLQDYGLAGQSIVDFRFLISDFGKNEAPDQKRRQDSQYRRTN